MSSIDALVVADGRARGAVTDALEEPATAGSFVVSTADTAGRALEILETASYDCVVCSREGVDAVDGFLEGVEERTRSVPVVIVAESFDEPTLEMAFGAGATDCLRLSDLEPGDRLAHRLERAVTASGTRRRVRALERSQRALEHAADAVVVTDREGTIEYVNPAFEELTGYSAAEAIGRTPRILKSGEQGRAYYERMWNAILEGEMWEEEIVNARRDGTLYHAHQLVAPIVDSEAGGSSDDGEIEGFVAIQRDVTDRRRVEDQLERSADTLSALHESMSDATRSTREKLERLLEIGTEHLEFPVGYVTEIDEEAGTQEIVAATGDPSLEEGQVDPLEETFCRRTIERDEPIVVDDTETDETWAGDPATNRFGYRCYIGARIVVGGTVTGTVCFAGPESRDELVLEAQRSTVQALARWIGHELDRRRYERRLERYEEIVDNVPVGVFRITAESGRFREVNPAVVEMFDADSTATICERELGELCRDPGRWEAIVEDLAAQGRVENAIVELETLAGDAFFGSVTAIQRVDDEDDLYVDGIVQDVTEREQAKAELAATTERLRFLFDRSPDAVVVHDREGNVLETNRTLRESLGYDRETLESMTVEEFEVGIDPDDLESLWTDAPLDSVLKLDGKHRRADGSTFPVEVWVSKIEYEGTAQFIALARDVTERRQRERELERRKAFVENVTDAITVLDGEIVEYASPGTQRVLGCEVDDLVGASLFEHVHPEDVSQVESTLEGILDEPDATDTVEYRFRCRNCESDWRWVESNVRNCREDDAVAGILVTTRDVTERKDRERELDRARTQLRQVIDLVPEMIYAKRRSGEYVLANQTVSELYGQPRDQVEGKTDEELLPSPAEAAQFRADDRRVIDSGERIHVEEEFTDVEGVTHVLETTKIPFEIAGTTEKAVLGYSRNVTDVKRQRDTLELLNQVVRHDVRNDMQVARGRAEMLEGHVDESAEPHLEEAVSAIDEAIELTKTARELTETLLEGTDETDAVPLAPVLESSVDSLRSKYPEASISLEAVPDVVVAADGMLESVFDNVLVNAVEHNDSAEPEVEVSVSTTGSFGDDEGGSDRESGSTVTVTIADNGPGIPDSRKEAIFGKEEKGLASPGTGIGLYLVDTIVSQYDGTVSVHDNEPAGSVFQIELRQVTPSAE
ncbi:PAS domain S-box protein [Natrarchaeobaculum aegyptiacum]|uniref:Histidine kinase n=1 Tax=Natrarchaeobaculum aegyptiacum TaxID=745377 RepID=A0A2Z2HTW8_9EURY|nr:PAS domain S-box protein [Natrarchaeobaculum aegyptiacum]ARS90686.1 hypothetical protein B1756_13745 [Natrarchaeobaculum aegyptiacum]